jgi:Protein ENHANCED DISEASE RESISTANCE 2, C-terminal
MAAGWCIAYWLGQRKGQSVGTKLRKPYNSPSSPRASSRNIGQPSNAGTAHPGKSEDIDMGGSMGPASTTAGTGAVANISIPPLNPEEEEVPGEESDDSAIDGEDLDYLVDDDDVAENSNIGKLSSPLPKHPANDEVSCWSEPPDPSIFRVRGLTYLEDRVKVPSGPSPFKCRGVDVWMTDNPERHIARHPNVLGGKLYEEDTFLVNFLLPFGNFVAYFSVPSLEDFPNKQVANVWSNFISGDQQYRDARLKLLPIVIDGPWIVKAAVGNGTAPALMGKVIPLQYFFQQPDIDTKRHGVYEVDVIITASSIAKGILSVVKGHTKSLTIAFALIIEAATHEDLPETVLCSFQVHYLNLDDCPHLPACNLDNVRKG